MRWVPAGVVVALALPATAQDPEPRVVQPSPKYGGVRATFTVRYVSDGAEAEGGDQLYVIGPRRTRCQGLVIQGPTGHDGGTQRIDMGPAANERVEIPRYGFRPRHPRTDRPINWCRGVYKGRVEWHGDDPDDEDVHTRFRFRVR